MLYLGPYFNLLPVFAVVLMVIQQQLMTPPPTDEQQELNQKVMKYMSIVIGFAFYKVAAGLCMYFIASSLWGLAERRMLPKKQQQQPLAPAVSTPVKAKPSPSPNGPRGRGRGPARKEDDTPLDKVKAWWADVLKQAKKK
jgi:YidC/Oxa1 family membrane protein insertase